MTEPLVTGIEIDLRANTLRLDLGGAVEGRTEDRASRQTAPIDIGAGGRLLGIDLKGQYVPVMDPEPGTETLIRSADVRVDATFDKETRQVVSITVPRRGEGYEITWPSGNQ